MLIDYTKEAEKLLPRIDRERRKALAVGNNRGREQAQVFAMATAVIEGLVGAYSTTALPAKQGEE